jgi:hypothetical protein
VGQEVAAATNARDSHLIEDFAFGGFFNGAVASEVLFGDILFPFSALTLGRYTS